MTDTANPVQAHVDRVWDDEIIPALFDYIAIPNVSKAFDPQWDEHGHMRRAVDRGLPHGTKAQRDPLGPDPLQRIGQMRDRDRPGHRA